MYFCQFKISEITQYHGHEQLALSTSKLTDLLAARGGGGVLDLSLGREVLPGPWNPESVYDKKFVKILKNRYSVYDFQVKFHSFFHQNAWFLDPVYKKSSNIFQFETLFMNGWSKNHTLKGGTSPYSLSMGSTPPGLAEANQHTGLYILQSCSFWVSFFCLCLQWKV